MSESKVTQGFQWEPGQRKGLFRTSDRTNLHALEMHVIDEIEIEMEKRPDVGSPTGLQADGTGKITLSPRHYGLSIAYPLSVCCGRSRG